jgi:hypothetical protein
MQNVSSLEQNIENQTSNLWLDAMIANSKALLGSIRKLQDKSSYEETKASNVYNSLKLSIMRAMSNANATYRKRGKIMT